MTSKIITQFSFWEFCMAVQEAIQDGYVFSTDNDKMPTAYVGNYSCVMVKDADQAVVADTSKSEPIGTFLDAMKGLGSPTTEPDSLVPEVKAMQTKGRKPKTN